jgi:uncharacterized protein
MILIDTGYILALFNPADHLHERAEAWSTTLTERLVVTEYVLWECVNSYSKSGNRETAHAIADFVLDAESCEFIPASSPLLGSGLRLHQARPDKEWSLTDCISFQVMAERGIARALAHDHHFEQAGFEALLRRDPR